MSTTTLTLPYKRFVAQVSTGTPRIKSTYLALMAENLEALKACPWKEADAANVSLANHDFTAKTHFSEAYDAFKMTGNYDAEAMTEVAYAGMAAYRFAIPAAAISGSVPISSIALPVTRDRYLRKGLRVVAVVTDDAEPATDWATIRGEGALAATAVLTQETVANLVSATAGTATVTMPEEAQEVAPAAYLFVYVTLEDYTDHWTMYNAKEQRQYAVEGSGMLVGDSAEVTFAGAVSADATEDGFWVVHGGVLPRPTTLAATVFSTARLLNGDAIAFEDSGGGAVQEAADAAIGLHAAYADLLLGRMSPLAFESLPATGRHGVGFTVRKGALTVPGKELGTERTVQAWRIALSALTVPFVVPGTGYGAVRLTWTATGATAARCRAWLMKGTLLETPEDANMLAAPGLWTGGEQSVAGFELLGAFSPEDGEAVFTADLSSGGVATLLFTAYLSPDDVDLSGAFPQGIGELDVSALDGRADGFGTLLVPNIELV